MATLREDPRIGFLVLNRNGTKWLRPLFQNLRATNYKNKKVFLIDNASTDGSVEMTLSEYPEVTVVRMPQNLGYCMAYNLAMPQAFADGCDWVVWANNDITIEPDCLDELVHGARTDPRIGVVGPAFLAWEGDEPNYYIQGNYPHTIPAIEAGSRDPIDVDWVEGSFLMVSRRCVEKVGPLDPYLFFYWEETDFCRRARHQGWRVVLVPSAIARHYAGGWSVADQRNKIAATGLQARNYYIYQLANPFQAFARNLLDALHLFLVLMKQNMLRQPSRVPLQVRSFAAVLFDLSTIYRKWARDRSGGHPTPTVEKFFSVTAEVIGGTVH